MRNIRTNQNKTHRSTGMEYSYFILRTVFGMLIFYVWTQSTNLFAKSGLTLFWELFIIMFFSGFIARVVAYILLKIGSKKGKGIMPGFYRLNFQPNINRISIIFIVGIALCSLVYAFGIDQAITEYLLPNQTGLWSMVVSYLFIKIGSQAIAWVFLKTRNI